MRSVSAIFTALLYLSLAVGISVSSHFCGGVHISSAIMMEAPSCGHHTHADMCDSHDPVEQQKKGCCSSDMEFFQLQDQPIVANVTPELPSASVVALLPQYTILSEATPMLKAELISHLTSKPPPLTVSGHLALVQSFLL